uniref:Protein kinase domain-containing protein n=1 Tax=Leersia perrieri TaxID=77586 RepID=A0A0D9XV68_9ORYZ
MSVCLGHERKVFVQMRSTVQAGGNQSDMVIEVCCCLGFAANVAQLTGLDVAGLVMEIKKRLETVHQNKEDCELLAERADLILDLLRRLQKSKIIQDPDMWKPTERLKSTLRKACEVIEFCQEKSCAYHFCKGSYIANELSMVLRDLEFYVVHLTALTAIIKSDQTTRYFLIQQTPDVVTLPDGVQVPVVLGVPAHHFEHNDHNYREETTDKPVEAQLVTRPSNINEFHLPVLHNIAEEISEENQRSGCCWWCPWKSIASASNAGMLIAKKETGLKRFTFSQLEVATDNFSLGNQIGVGAFSIVYRGRLNEGLQIAVKRASYVGKTPFHQLENELDLIPKLQHTNIVKLLGYCIQKRERILVFEYMPLRSLDSFITGERAAREPLDWPKRSQIVRGIAQGAVYLHKLCEPRIIHGDLKPGNILLDAALKPKICDFGISKALKADADKDCTDTVVGSRGFMAPEYKQGGCLSLQTDVYSFGATLLQIISGKHISPSTLVLSDESRNYGPLNKWAWHLWQDGNLTEFIDSSLHDETHATEIKRWVQIALLCVQQSSEERPSMWDVLLMLSCDSLILPDPQLPAYY